MKGEIICYKIIIDTPNSFSVIVYKCSHNFFNLINSVDLSKCDPNIKTCPFILDISL